MKVAILSSAALAASLLTGLLTSAPAKANYVEAYGSCASGYHPDREGNCQPNVAETNRYCPPGQVYHPFPDGWFCTSPTSRTFYGG